MFIVHGNWSTWGNWNTCSVSCNGGQHTRSRKCDNPKPAHGGKECSSDGSGGSMIETCGTDPCPSNLPKMIPP